MSQDAPRTPVLLAILDGIGIAPAGPSNAVTAADAPFLDELMSDTTWPCVSLQASGRAVGLPVGQMGNSEVGHLNIGAGRIVNQELTRIDLAIEDGSLAANPVFRQTFSELVDSGACLHFLGLLSDGGVHSDQAHLEALVALAAASGIRQIAIHACLDGRDVAPTSGVGYVQRLVTFMQDLSAQYPGLDIRLATLGGRYYGMDRDKRWPRVQAAYDAMTAPAKLAYIDLTTTQMGEKTLATAAKPETPTSSDPTAAKASYQSALAPAIAAETAFRVDADADPVALLRASYALGVNDEFVLPMAFGDSGVSDGDALVFFNFRPDRARELTRAFIDPDFTGFPRFAWPRVSFTCMTEYDPDFAASFQARVAFPKSFPKNVLADYLSDLGLKQLHIAETEKYAHVTFFFNGGIEDPKAGEERILIASPKVATYDLQPEMSAPEVTSALVAAIRANAADVYIVNYANGDMVGHTGVQAAAEQAVAAVDRGLQEVVMAILAADGVALVTADHGNADVMADADGNVWTAHSLSPVPLALLCAEAVESQDQPRRWTLRHKADACLADIAPTLLDVMGLPAPAEFTGVSLLERLHE